MEVEIAFDLRERSLGPKASGKPTPLGRALDRVVKADVKLFAVQFRCTQD